MITVFKTPSNEQFFNLVKSSEHELLFCAPFIKKEIIDIILSLKKPGTVLEVITSANLANFVSGSLDVEAIKTLLANGVRVLNYQNLHAKIYLFDNKKALVTSANLTNNALYNNYEYGLLLHEDEQDTVNQIYSDFISMMDDKELCGSFDKESIKEIERFVKTLKTNGLVRVDEEGDNLLPIDEKLELSKNLKGWKKDIFDCLTMIKKQDFSLSDVYSFHDALKIQHPDNNTIHSKIRQTLQQLRDLGFVKFTEPGKYKKLWLDISLISSGESAARVSA